MTDSNLSGEAVLINFDSSVVNDKLIEKIEQRDRKITLLEEALDRTRSLHESQTKCRDYASAKLEELLDSRQKKIETLEDNLNRARSEHLEQLRAIAQMLQPLIGRPYNSTENKDGKTYVHVNHANEFTHAEKNSAIKLIQKVVYANIKRLDPYLAPASYDDDF